MESFFATLKKEKLYQIPTYRMKREEVKTFIFRYVFGYYNTQRINSFNEGGLPPVALRTSTGLAHHAACILPIHDFGHFMTALFLTIPLISFLNVKNNVIKLGLGLELPFDKMCWLTWCRDHEFPISEMDFDISEGYIKKGKSLSALFEYEDIFENTKRKGKEMKF